MSAREYYAPDRSSALLSLDSVVTEFRTETGLVRGVDGVSYDVRPGECLGIVGESGSGKSVTVMSALGLLPPSATASGHAWFGEHDLLSLSEKQLTDIRGRDIGMIFQDPMTALNPVMTIGTQIDETITRHNPGMSRASRRDRVHELLNDVGIANPAERAGQYPHQFSGGMRQRVMVAIAIANRPKLIIADEPTTALDVTIQAQILSLLKRLRTELDMAVLIITHDLGVVAGFADRLAVMYAGRLVEIGRTEEVLASPSHPYTIGLLRSLPRLDRPRQAALTPIEGSPPDLASNIAGCPFAPRCAWRVEASWTTGPDLAPARTARVVTDLRDQHRVACHNQPTAEEAAEGRPLRPGVLPAPPPVAASAAP